MLFIQFYVSLLLGLRECQIGRKTITNRIPAIDHIADLDFKRFEPSSVFEPFSTVYGFK